MLILINTDWDKLITALDNYKSVQAKWDTATSQSGFYDPCDSQKKHYELDIADAEESLNEVFTKLVRKASYGCQCPHQPLL